MNESLNQILAEAMIHVNWCKNTCEHFLTEAGNIIACSPPDLSAKEIDEYTERFVRTFYPKAYKELFR